MIMIIIMIIFIIIIIIIIIVLTFLVQFIHSFNGKGRIIKKKNNMLQKNYLKSWENLNNLLHTFSTFFILSIVVWLLTFSIYI